MVSKLPPVLDLAMIQSFGNYFNVTDEEFPIKSVDKLNKPKTELTYARYEVRSSYR